ncbi:MAG: hypothetical protein NT067_00050 [Candidatus Diapherotrites archaeon]|nr:hypothetical protein [Candidatus Diapherotrites archaeon]
MGGKLKDFTGKTCKGHTAFEFQPKAKQNMDFVKIKALLAEKGISPEASTPLVVIFKFDGCTVSLFKSGKILVKEKTEEKAKKVAEKIMGLL